MRAILAAILLVLAVAPAPASTDRTRAAELNRIAIALLDRGESRQAIAAFNAAVAADPTHLTSYENRAIAYMGLEDYARAIADFDRLIALAPTPMRHALRGACRAAAGDLSGGLADADAALAREPAHAFARNLRAHVLDRLAASTGASSGSRGEAPTQ